MASRVARSRLDRIRKGCSSAMKEGNQAVHHQVCRKNALGRESIHAAGGNQGSRIHHYAHRRDCGGLGSVHGVGHIGGSGDIGTYKPGHNINPT